MGTDVVKGTVVVVIGVVVVGCVGGVPVVDSLESNKILVN